MTMEKTDVVSAPNEIEYKFENLANTQFKFIPIENAENMLRKVRTLCDILDITLGESVTKEVEDDYFDIGYALRKRHGSFRLRRLQQDRQLITLKVKQDPSGRGELQRLEDEFECNNEEFQSLIANPMVVSKRLKEKLGLDVALTGEFKKVLTVRNNRNVLPLITEVARYEFFYDRYYYYYADSGEYSEHYAEIEIELHGQKLTTDPQLDKFRQAIKDLLNYTANRKSKLERGLDRLSNGIETVYAAALDIVGYSIKPADIQKQTIQRLNHLAKTSIRESRGAGTEQDVIYLPTGDGMIMVFKDRPDTLPRIVCDLQEKVKRNNSQCPLDRRFEFRAGLHSGPAFKYSDVNENNNFAGNGINLAQRVMSLGDEWHILATREGFEAMGRVSIQNKDLFHSVGRYKVKHGEELDVFNVYDQNGPYGNPSRPE